MNHCGTYTIETKRLLLREFMVEDAEAMFQNWASDKEVTKFLTWPAYTSLDTAIHILSEWTASYEKSNGQQVDIDFDVYYLMQELNGKLHIFGWISGNEQELLKQYGII